MKQKLLVLFIAFISTFMMSVDSKACDGMDVQAISVSYIGNGQYLVTIEYCEVVSNGVGASVHGILAEIVGANIIGTQTPSITSSSTGITMNYNQINGTSAEWGDWDNDAAPIFMDSGDPMECFTVTLICDAAPTSVTFAGSSNNTNIGGGFVAINGRFACVTTVIFPPATCESEWTPPTFCPGSTTLIDLNATTLSVGVFSGTGVNSTTGMFDPTGITGPVSVSFFVGDSSFNCTTVHTIEPIISNFNVITSDITINCAQDSVEISGYADAGMEPWTYSWDTGDTDSNIWVPGDATATYTLTVNDACGGTAQNTVTVTYAPDPVPTISFNGGATQTICAGDQLTIDVTISGGSGAFTYIWSTSNTMSPQLSTNQNIVVSPTADTWYYLQINDGCYTVLDSMRVLMGTVDAAFNVTAVTSCPPGINNDGGITIIPNPVSGNYTFDISGGVPPVNLSNTTGVFTTLTNGAYQIQIVDINSGCILDTIIIVPVITGNPPSHGVVNVNHVSCNGANDASIEVVNIDGTSGNLPFDIIWTPTTGAPITENDIVTSIPSTHSQTGLYGSTWVVTIIDDLGCSESFPVVVNEPDIIDLGLTSNEPLCFGQSNGSVYINATGGTLNYTFTILDSDSVQLNQNNSNAAEQIPTGWYYTSLVDANGCYAGDSLFLDHPDSLYALISTVNPPCYGQPFGIAEVTDVIDNQGPVQYSWSPSGDTDTLANHLDAGDHTITIVDSVGCIWQGSFTLVYPDSLYISTLSSLPAYCRGSGLYPGSGTVSATASGGTGTITYMWVGNGETAPSNTWGNREPAWYIIQATDANGCQVYDSVYVDSLNPIADFTVNPMNGTEPVTVTITDLSQNRVTNTWDLGLGGSSSYIIGYDSLQPAFDTVYTTGDYIICLAVANDFECYDTLCQTIEIYPVPNIELPNVITPNGDNNNDFWSPINEGMASLSCTIVNRWGNVIFVIDGPTDTWDGTNQKSGKKVATGVYSFVYTATAFNGTEFSGHGFVHVID